MTRWLVGSVAAAALAVGGGCGDAGFDIFPGVTEIGAPNWSSDGTALVFHIQAQGESHIYRVGADGSDLEKLTSLQGYSRSPAWSPDSRRLAFSRAVDYLTYDLYVANADGSDPKRVHRGHGDSDHPTWSPDGTRVAFVVGGVDQVLGSAGALVTLDLQSGSFRRLGPLGARNPAWSPTGRWVAFSRSENEAYGVYVVRADGRGAGRLVIRDASDPTWSPDGRLLAVSRGTAGIFVVVVAGGGVRRLPIDVQMEIGLGDLAWSPDGTRIAYATTDALHIATVDGTGVRKVAAISDVT